MDNQQRTRGRAIIRKHLEQAISDIDCYLTDMGELRELFDVMESGRTPPKVKGRGKHRLNKTMHNAVVHGTSVHGKPLTYEKREAILADLPFDQPTGDKGDWRRSSRQAADWLRKAEETLSADAIDDKLSGATYVSTIEAEQVRMILADHLEEQPIPSGSRGGNKTPRKKREPIWDDKTWMPRYEAWKKEHNRTGITQRKYADKEKWNVAETVKAFTAMRTRRNRKTAANSANLKTSSSKK